MREDNQEDEGRADGTRRRFLLWLPVVVLGSIAATLTASAYRFLRPRSSASSSSSGEAEGWRALARLEEFRGDAPFMREFSVEHEAGWRVSEIKRAVFIFPGEGPRVLSSVCPHEGCDVEWRAAQREFACPCHDSRFNAEGAPLSGPATEPLARIPSRVNDGALEIREAETSTLSTNDTPTGA